MDISDSLNTSIPLSELEMEEEIDMEEEILISHSNNNENTENDKKQSADKQNVLEESESESESEEEILEKEKKSPSFHHELSQSLDLRKKDDNNMEDDFFKSKHLRLFKRISIEHLFLKNEFKKEVVFNIRYNNYREDKNFGLDNTHHLFTIEFNPSDDYLFTYPRIKVEFLERGIKKIIYIQNEEDPNLIDIFIKYQIPPNIFTMTDNFEPFEEMDDDDEEEDIENDEKPVHFEWGGDYKYSAQKTKSWTQGTEKYNCIEDISDYPLYHHYKSTLLPRRKKKKRKGNEIEKYLSTINSFPLGFGYSDYFSICIDRKNLEKFQKKLKRSLSPTSWRFFKRKQIIVNTIIDLKEEEKEGEEEDIINNSKDFICQSFFFQIKNTCGYLNDYRYIKNFLCSYENNTHNFDILNLLECCISRNQIIRENLTKEFFERFFGKETISKDLRVIFLKKLLANIDFSILKTNFQDNQIMSEQQQKRKKDKVYDPLVLLDEFIKNYILKNQEEEDKKEFRSLEKIRTELGIEFFELKKKDEDEKNEGKKWNYSLGLEEPVNIVSDNYLVKGVILTPTKVSVNFPRIDCGNRVLRQYPNHGHKFLRVKFLEDSSYSTSRKRKEEEEEEKKNKNNNKKKKQKRKRKSNSTTVLKKLYNQGTKSKRFPRRNKNFEKMIRFIMNHGFYYHGRTYKFLQYSESQLRTGSCWLFCDNIMELKKKKKRDLEDLGSIKKDEKIVNSTYIREKIGNFRILSLGKKKIKKISTLPQRASRMGLVLSASKGVSSFIHNDFNSSLEQFQPKLKTEEEKKKVFEEDDILRNDYNFTDGCGKIDEEYMISMFKKIYYSNKKTKRWISTNKNSNSILKKNKDDGREYSDICTVQVRCCGYKGLVTKCTSKFMKYYYQNMIQEKEEKEEEEEEEEESEDEEEKEEKKYPKLIFRNSQKKFETEEFSFDICHAKTSQFRPLFLNREIIMNLEARDVIDCVEKYLTYLGDFPGGGDNSTSEEEDSDSDSENENEEKNKSKKPTEEMKKLFKSKIMNGEISRKCAEDLEKNEGIIRMLYTKKIEGRENEQKEQDDEIVAPPCPSQRILHLLDEMVENLNLQVDGKDEGVIRNNMLTIFQDRKYISRLVFASINNEFTIRREPFLKKIVNTLSRNLKKLVLSKNNIYIPEGARLFGICDETWGKVLRTDEVFCSLVIKDEQLNQKQKKNLEGDVYIIKNPCVHIGDGRVQKAVSLEEIERRLEENMKKQIHEIKNKTNNQIKNKTNNKSEKRIRKEKEEMFNWFRSVSNVVVFSVQGDRPSFHKMSGSDLDGDEYVIIYDEKLIYKIKKYKEEEEDFNNNNNKYDVNFKSLMYDKFDEVDENERNSYFYNSEIADQIMNYYEDKTFEEDDPVPQENSNNNNNYIDEKEDLIDYLIKYQSIGNLGEVSNLEYTHYAKSVLGLLSPKCRILGVFHSLSVDSTKIGIGLPIPGELKIRERSDFILNTTVRERFESKNLCGIIFKKMIEILTDDYNREKHKRNENKEEMIEIDKDIIDLDIYKRNTPKIYEDYMIPFLDEAEKLFLLYVEQIELICSQYSLEGEEVIFSRSHKFLRKQKGVSIRSLDITIKHLFGCFKVYFRKRCTEEAFKLFPDIDPGKKIEPPKKKEKFFRVRSFFKLLMSMCWYQVCYSKKQKRYLGMAWFNYIHLGTIKKDRLGRNPNWLMKYLASSDL